MSTHLSPATSLVETRSSESWLDWSSRLATTAMTSATGFALSGPVGAVAGSVAAAVDEALISLEFQKKHLLSSTLFWTASVLAPIGTIASGFYSSPSSTLEFSAYLAGGLGLSYLFDDFFDLNAHIRSPLKAMAQANVLFEVHGTEERKQVELIEPKQNSLYSSIKGYFENPFLTSITKKIALGLLTIGIECLFLKFLSSSDLQTYGMQLLQNKSLKVLDRFDYQSKADWSTLCEAVSPLAKDALKVLGALVIKNKLVWSLRNYRKKMSHNQHAMVMEKVTECLLHKGRGSELMAQEDGAELLQHMNSDFSHLMNEGVERLDKFIQDSALWIYGLATLHQTVPGILGGYLFSTLPLQRTYEGMVRKIKELGHQLSGASTELAQVKQDIAEHMGQIELRDGTDYLNEQYDEALECHNAVSAELQQVKAHWEQTTNLYQFYQEVITYASFGLSVAMKKMTLTDLALFKKSAEHVVHSLSGNLTVQNKGSELNLAQERIQKLITILQKPVSSKVERKESLDGSIQIENYRLNLNGQELLSVPHLKLLPGKVYSVTGHSGCGKSSFLKDLKQGVLGRLSSSGTVYLPSSVLFIDQDVYLPPNRTLFETICFPSSPSSLRNFEQAVTKQAILNLFEALEINHDQQDPNTLKLADLLDSKEFQLSGGQRKKIALIQAILQKPKVLMLDESFVGLDPYSLDKANTVIKSYLPETMILSIDHHAFEDHSKFYDQNLHFENGQISVH